jgi:hypothetical protein
LFVTSASGLFGNFGQPNYAAAEMGLVGLAMTAAIDGARYGIQSNAIAPLARTPMTDGVFGGTIEACDPEFVVPMALYLVSESCRLIHEIRSAGGRRFARAVVGVTRGWVSATRRRSRTCTSTSPRSAPKAISSCRRALPRRSTWRARSSNTPVESSTSGAYSRCCHAESASRRSAIGVLGRSRAVTSATRRTFVHGPPSAWRRDHGLRQTVKIGTGVWLEV